MIAWESFSLANGSWQLSFLWWHELFNLLDAYRRAIVTLINLKKLPGSSRNIERLRLGWTPEEVVEFEILVARSAGAINGKASEERCKVLRVKSAVTSE